MTVIGLGDVSRNMRHPGTKSRGFRSCAKSTMSGLVRTVRPFPTLTSQLAFISHHPATSPTCFPPTLSLGLSNKPYGMDSISNVATDIFHVFLP